MEGSKELTEQYTSKCYSKVYYFSIHEGVKAFSVKVLDREIAFGQAALEWSNDIAWKHSQLRKEILKATGESHSRVWFQPFIILTLG